MMIILGRLARPLLSVLGMALALPASTQTAAELEALRSNPAAVRERLQASGLTPAQIRERLQASGYPRSMLDAFMDPANGNSSRASDPVFAAALQAIGLPFEQAAAVVGVDSGLVMNRSGSVPSRVFGVDVFRRGASQFLPTLAGPVPSDYRLRPGDELLLILTGQVEAAHRLLVSRDGSILIPDVGQVPAANLMLSALRTVLRDRLGRVYSGVRAGPAAPTRFEVSVISVGSAQVYVVGEVVQPGAYQISALGTVLTALYAAGGPSENGDLRHVEVRRGPDVIASLDLYGYLLRGETATDIRLETGDVVFVGLHGPQVEVTGHVLREGIYELAADESLADVIAAAGGLRPDAARERLTVHRLLPDSMPTRDLGRRMALSVGLTFGPNGTLQIPPLDLRGGDSIVVDSLPHLNSGYYVTVVGQITKHGRFPWQPNMTVRDLVALGQGVRIGADLREAEIARMPDGGQSGALARRLRVPLDSSYLPVDPSAFAGPPGPAFASPGSAPEVPLEPYDEVLILPRPGFEPFRSVTITGQVEYPGTYVLVRRDETLSDLVAHAGGLRENAYSDAAQLHRRAGRAGRLNANLTEALRQPGSRADITLADGDSIHVPEYLGIVRVEGAVLAPSSVLFREGADLDYYVESAGGFGPHAAKGRVSVTYANGDRRAPSRFLFWRSFPSIRPDAVITVPQGSPGSPFNMTQFLGVVAQVVASTIAIIVVVRQ